MTTDGDHDELSKYVTQNKSPPGSVFHYYSRFGCYWNFFPKTDYTYLPSSPLYKKEISPGIPIIPNLSRHPIRRKKASSTSYSASEESSAYLGDTSRLVDSSEHESTLCDQHSNDYHSSKTTHGVASLVQSTLDIVKTAVTTTITRTTTIVTTFTDNIVTSVTDTVSPPPTASLVRRLFGFLALLLLLLLLLLLIILLLGKSNVPILRDSLLAATQSGTGAIETRFDKGNDVSFILSTFDSIRRRLDYLEQKVDSRVHDKAEYNDVKEKIHSIETNLAQLKTDLQQTEKSIADSQSSQNYDLTMKTHIDMKVVSQVVDSAIKKYHADFVSKPDFALQSSGSEVVSIRCTQMYSNPGQYYLFGRPIPFFEKKNNPDIVLKPGTMPGECFAFEGQQGYIVIKLSSRIKVTDFTMDHAPKEILPRGHMASAPKDFEVVGLRDLYDFEPVELGKFRFLDNGESVQQFKAKDLDESFDLVELKITSNHGHNDYTCLYRFRVHGIPVDETSLL